MDWEDWTKRLKTALGADATVRLRELFAPGGVFSDPVTAPTTDIKSVEDITDSSFPGLATRRHVVTRGPDAEAPSNGSGGAPSGPDCASRCTGCTMVELDADGQVTRWRDYFDLKEIETQMGATIEDYQDSSGT